MTPFDFNAWLNEPIDVQEIDGSVVKKPRHERICWLVLCNGGFGVSGWGVTDNAGPGGHQRGLDQADALDLLQTASFLLGLGAAGVDWNTPLAPIFAAYRESWIAKIREPALEGVTGAFEAAG